MANGNILPDDPRPFLTVKEVASYLRVCPHTVYALIARKKDPPPFIRYTRQLIRFPTKDFLRWNSKQ